jgi:hypothetical protein
MPEESTGYWADTIGKGLEGIRAKMDLGIGPREVTFGWGRPGVRRPKSPGVPTIFASPAAHETPGDFRVRALLPDERGNLTDLTARTFHPSSDDPRRLDGDTWHTLGLQFGTIAAPMDNWSSTVVDGLHPGPGPRRVIANSTPRSAVQRGAGWHLFHKNENVPSETMFREMQRYQNDHPPSAEDISDNSARLRTRTDINRDSGLGKEEILVKTNPLRLTARRPSDNRWSLSDAERVSRMGAFHTGTGGFRFLED